MRAHGRFNPHVLSLLARVRHSPMNVIAAYRGFSFWPMLETVDPSLADGAATLRQVLRAVRQNFVIGEVFVAGEFLKVNSRRTKQAYAAALKGGNVTDEPHVDFNRREPGTIGLIRSGDTVRYASMILISA